jgi:hypothetical protein
LSNQQGDGGRKSVQLDGCRVKWQARGRWKLEELILADALNVVPVIPAFLGTVAHSRAGAATGEGVEIAVYCQAHARKHCGAASLVQDRLFAEGTDRVAQLREA